MVVDAELFLLGVELRDFVFVIATLGLGSLTADAVGWGTTARKSDAVTGSATAASSTAGWDADGLAVVTNRSGCAGGTALTSTDGGATAL